MGFTGQYMGFTVTSNMVYRGIYLCISPTEFDLWVSENGTWFALYPSWYRTDNMWYSSIMDEGRISWYQYNIILLYNIIYNLYLAELAMTLKHFLTGMH
jgi:hypothetical protein